MGAQKGESDSLWLVEAARSFLATQVEGSAVS